MAIGAHLTGGSGGWCVWVWVVVVVVCVCVWGWEGGRGRGGEGGEGRGGEGRGGGGEGGREGGEGRGGEDGEGRRDGGDGGTDGGREGGKWWCGGEGGVGADVVDIESRKTAAQHGSPRRPPTVGHRGLKKKVVARRALDVQLDGVRKMPTMSGFSNAASAVVIFPNLRGMTQGRDCQTQGTRKSSVLIFKCGRRDDIRIQVRFHAENRFNSSKSFRD